MGKKVKVKIKEIISERGISLRELSRKTDIRHDALSKLGNQKMHSIYFEHIEKIAESLEIDDIREIINFEDSE